MILFSICNFGRKKNLFFLAFIILFFNCFCSSVFSQASNSSSLTNSAAPSASSITNGGTNINYQTNNAYQNEVGFGPGVFCRTPTIFLGGNYGQNELDAFDTINKTGNTASNFSGNIGVVLPFGSSALSSCRQLAKITVQDREISTQLSLLRACAGLQREGIRVDAKSFPLLERCTVSVLGPSLPAVMTQQGAGINIPRSTEPKPSLPNKIPQTTRS